MSNHDAGKDIEKQLRELVSNRKAAASQFGFEMDTFFDNSHQKPSFSKKTYEEISAKYVLDDSDFEEDDVDDKPVKVRSMAFLTQKIFSRKPSKPQADQQERPQVYQQPQQPIQNQVFEPVKKQILVDRDTQSPKSHLSPTFNCPIQIFPEHTEKEIKTYNTQATNTKEARRRNEATETEALLPQYEAKCMELIQSILNEAPLCANNMPSEEALGDLLLQFVNQILKDAQDIPIPSQPSKSIVDSDIYVPKSTIERELPEDVVDKAEYKTESVQLDSVDTMDNGTQTQRKITLMSLETRQGASVPPDVKEQPALAIGSTLLNVSTPYIEEEKPNVSLTQPQAQFNIFQYPPPLVEEERKPILIQEITSPVTSFVEEEKPKKPQQNMQLETLVSKSVDIPPPFIPKQTRRQTFSSDDEPIIPDSKPVRQKVPEKQPITLPPLSASIIQLPDDLQTVSVLNLDSDENLLDSSINGDDTDASSTLGSTTETSTVSTVNTSTIERLIDSSYSISTNKSDNSFSLNDMSSGEVKSSILDDDSYNSSILDGSSSEI